LLVSTDFLSSQYIKDHELSAFVASDPTAPEPGKRVIPVALRSIPFDNSIDLKGLERLQFFPERDQGSFDRLNDKRTREDFAERLFQQILKTVEPGAHPPLNHYQGCVFTTAILESKKKGVKRILISGLNTDPLSSSMTAELIREARRGAPQMIGLNTRLYHHENKRVEQVIEALFMDCQEGDYLSITLDAGTPGAYATVTKADENRFQQVRENLQTVKEKRDKWKTEHGSKCPLRLNITYLLLPTNTVEQDIAGAIELATRVEADALRFSVPQPAKPGLEDFKTIEPEKIREIKNVISNISTIRAPRIVIRDYDHWSAKGFKYCYAQMFFPTLGADGKFYPCCQVAAGDFEALSSLPPENWEQWSPGTRWDQVIARRVGDIGKREENVLACGRRCNRRDGAINSLLAGLLMTKGRED